MRKRSHAHEMGKGIYCMKALRRHLATDLARSLDYVMSCKQWTPAVGIASEQELELAIAVFEGRPIEDAAVAELVAGRLCTLLTGARVRKCVARCDHGAVRIVEGKASRR